MDRPDAPVDDQTQVPEVRLLTQLDPRWAIPLRAGGAVFDLDPASQPRAPQLPAHSTSTVPTVFPHPRMELWLTHLRAFQLSMDVVLPAAHAPDTCLMDLVCHIRRFLGPQEPEVVWFLGHLLRNRLMHALNGNRVDEYHVLGPPRLAAVEVEFQNEEPDVVLQPLPPPMLPWDLMGQGGDIAEFTMRMRVQALAIVHWFAVDAHDLVIFLAAWQMWERRDLQLVRRVVALANMQTVQGVANRQRPEDVLLATGILSHVCDTMEQLGRRPGSFAATAGTAPTVLFQRLRRFDPSVHLHTAAAAARFARYSYGLVAAELPLCLALCDAALILGGPPSILFRPMLLQTRQWFAARATEIQMLEPSLLPLPPPTGSRAGPGDARLFLPVSMLVRSFLPPAEIVRGAGADTEGYGWFVHRLVRNRLAHALNGNTGTRVPAKNERLNVRPLGRGGRGVLLLPKQLLLMAAFCCFGQVQAGAPAVEHDVLPVVVASANVTSLEAHWDAIAASPWDLLTVQEARISPDSRVVRDTLRAGGDVRLGALGTDGKALLCVLACKGTLSPARPVPGTDSLRSQLLTWHPGGPCSWNICNVYAEADGSAESKLRTSVIVREALAEFEATRRQPAIIAGDLNAQISELPVAPALGCSGWVDPAADVPTSSAAFVPRRIDHFLMNSSMERRYLSHVVDWTLGLPTHAWQAVTLRAGRLPNVPVWLQAPVLPDPGEGMDRQAASLQVVGLLRQVHQAVALQDLPLAWRLLLEAGERYAHHRAGKRFAGIRTPSRVEWQPPEPVAKGTEAPEDFASRRARTRVHRIEHLLVFHRKGHAETSPAASLRAALLGAEGVSSWWKGPMRAANGVADWERLLALAKEQLQAEAVIAKAASRDRWYAWCNEQLYTGGSRVYKWVRQGTSFQAPPEGHPWEEGTEAGPPQGVRPRSNGCTPIGWLSGGLETQQERLTSALGCLPCKRCHLSRCWRTLMVRCCLMWFNVRVSVKLQERTDGPTKSLQIGRLTSLMRLLRS